MFSGLRPYSAYKGSPQRWYGTLPEKWNALSHRGLFSEIRDVGHPDAEMLSVTISRGVISQEALLDGSAKKDGSNEDRSKYKLVCVGDLVYNKMRAWQGAIGLSGHLGIVSPAYVVMRPALGHERLYFHHLLRTPAFAKEAERWSYGITSDQWSLRPEHFKMISCAVPPREDQAAIVKFMAHANVRIDRAIAAKRKMIALLDEQKRVAITQAVTRGVDSGTVTRDKGFSWLDAVPRTWKTPQLGRCLTRVEQGWSPTAAEGELRDDQWAVLTLSAVQRGHFRSEALKPIPLDQQVPAQMEVLDGDLLLTRSNTRDRVGDVAIVRGVRPKTIISDLIYRLIVNKEMLSPEFLRLLLLSDLGRSQIMRDARGSSGTMPKIAQSHIRSWRVAMPPLPVQENICAVVGSMTAGIDVAQVRLGREIELLKEFRTRLTADVVTGQLDVREAAAKLPDLDPTELATADIDDSDDLDAVAEEFLDEADR